MYRIDELMDLSHTLAKDYFSQFTYPWEALPGIHDMILDLGKTLDPNEYDQPQENVWVHFLFINRIRFMKLMISF